MVLNSPWIVTNLTDAKKNWLHSNLEIRKKVSFRLEVHYEISCCLKKDIFSNVLEATSCSDLYWYCIPMTNIQERDFSTVFNHCFIKDSFVLVLKNVPAQTLLPWQNYHQGANTLLLHVFFFVLTSPEGVLMSRSAEMALELFLVSLTVTVLLACHRRIRV